MKTAEIQAAYNHWAAAAEAVQHHLDSATPEDGTLVDGINAMSERDAIQWCRRLNDLTGAKRILLNIFAKTQGGLTDEQVFWMTD